MPERDLYFIEKHRFYELKHFCLQYPKWVEAYEKLKKEGESKCPDDDPTSRIGIKMADYARNIDIVHRMVLEADISLSETLLRGVTSGKIPMNKDVRERYYMAYRRFFWLLDREKGI